MGLDEAMTPETRSSGAKHQAALATAKQPTVGTNIFVCGREPASQEFGLCLEEESRSDSIWRGQVTGGGLPMNLSLDVSPSMCRNTDQSQGVVQFVEHKLLGDQGFVGFVHYPRTNSGTLTTQAYLRMNKSYQVTILNQNSINEMIDW
jgi:hypothetical protein